MVVRYDTYLFSSESTVGILEAVQALGAASSSSRAPWWRSGCCFLARRNRGLPELLLGLSFLLGGTIGSFVEVAGVAAAACYWLAFFPLEAYRRSVRARAAAQA